MAVTLRYATGFKGSNAKYVIRRKTTVHFYEENGKKMVRITKSLERRVKDNYSKNISKDTSTATVSMNGSNGAIRRYVAVS